MWNNFAIESNFQLATNYEILHSTLGPTQCYGVDDGVYTDCVYYSVHKTMLICSSAMSKRYAIFIC